MKSRIQITEPFLVLKYVDELAKHDFLIVVLVDSMMFQR